MSFGQIMLEIIMLLRLFAKDGDFTSYQDLLLVDDG